MNTFVETYGVSGIEHIVDDSGDIWAGFDVVSQPAWVFINDDGEQTLINGALGGDELEARIQALIDA